MTLKISPLERSEKDSVLPRRNSGEAQFGRGAIREAKFGRGAIRTNKKLLTVKPESELYVYDNHRRAVR